MADKKITELNTLAGADVVNADKFVVVDISADETKAITYDQFRVAFNAGVLLESELASVADVKALDQSVISGASPVFTISGMTLDNSNNIVVESTNMQDFAEGVDHALLKARGTGVTSTYISTVSVGGTTFAQPAVFGEINSDEGYFDIHYTGATNVTVASLSAASTYVYIDKSGDLQQQTTTPSRQDWSRKIFTMRIGVDTVAEEIIGFEYLNNPIGHYANSIRDLYSYLLSQGIPFKKDQIVTGRAGDLGFDVSAGSIMEFGGTGDINNANVKDLDAVANASYTLLSRTAVVSTETTLVKYWDNAGSITALGSTTLVGHRLYRFSNGNFAIQYGQGNYANMALAKAGVLLEDYQLNPQLLNATFFGWWFIESTATNTGGTILTDFKEYTIGVQGGSSSSLSGALLKGNNLSDLPDAAAARVNLGLNLTEGYSSDAEALGTISNGTLTPAIGDENENFKTMVNGGAFTLEVPSVNTEIILQVTNNGSAGTITFASGYQKVGGDSLTTTNGHDFFIHIVRIGAFASVNVQALQ